MVILTFRTAGRGRSATVIRTCCSTGRRWPRRRVPEKHAGNGVNRRVERRGRMVRFVRNDCGRERGARGVYDDDDDVTVPYRRRRDYNYTARTVLDHVRRKSITVRYRRARRTPSAQVNDIITIPFFRRARRPPPRHGRDRTRSARTHLGKMRRRMNRTTDEKERNQRENEIPLTRRNSNFDWIAGELRPLTNARSYDVARCWSWWRITQRPCACMRARANGMCVCVCARVCICVFVYGVRRAHTRLVSSMRPPLSAAVVATAAAAPASATTVVIDISTIVCVILSLMLLFVYV